MEKAERDGERLPPGHGDEVAERQEGRGTKHPRQEA